MVAQNKPTQYKSFGDTLEENDYKIWLRSRVGLLKINKNKKQPLITGNKEAKVFKLDKKRNKLQTVY